MWIRADESGRLGIRVREIASTAAGHEYLLACPVRAFQYDYAPAALPGCDRTHEAGGSAADNDNVDMFHPERITVPSTSLRGVFRPLFEQTHALYQSELRFVFSKDDLGRRIAATLQRTNEVMQMLHIDSNYVEA